MTEHEMKHEHGGGMGHDHPPSGDQPSTHGTHNQMVVGEQTVYLSHLPMFDPRFPEHHFQVILEVKLTQPDDAQATYTEDRQSHPDVRMYTMNPKAFDITELDPQNSRRTTLTGDVFRGHFERESELLIRRATAEVARVVRFHRFEPGARPREHLEYLLFGKAPDLFLAHVLVGAPDFDQILGVTVSSGEVSAEDLERGVRVQIPGRANNVRTRIQPGERVTAQAQRPGAQGDGPLELQLEAGTEFYFEEGEMRSPMDMAQTAEERKAGF
jgi:hypothetical protein